LGDEKIKNNIMKGYKNIQSTQELDQKLSPFGFRVNEKGEITVIGEKDGKEYKIGMARKKVVSSEEMKKFLEKSDKQEKDKK
jgi:hypothetical protein